MTNSIANTGSAEFGLKHLYEFKDDHEHTDNDVFILKKNLMESVPSVPDDPWGHQGAVSVDPLTAPAASYSSSVVGPLAEEQLVGQAAPEKMVHSELCDEAASAGHSEGAPAADGNIVVTLPPEDPSFTTKAWPFP